MKDFTLAICFALLSAPSFGALEFNLIYSEHYNSNLEQSLKEKDYFPSKDYARTAHFILTNGHPYFPNNAKRLFHDVAPLELARLKSVHAEPYVALLTQINRYDFQKLPTQPVATVDVLKLLRQNDYVDIANALKVRSPHNTNARIFGVAQEILRVQRLGSAGTLRATELLLPLSTVAKASINLSGGYHHADYKGGAGFCLINDVAIAVKHFLAQNPAASVLIVDLDAHFGDGNFDIFEEDEHVRIFDIHNKKIFPFDEDEEEEDYNGRHYIYGIEPRTKDKAYLALLKQGLKEAIVATSPDIVFYNAGTDVYIHDPIGELAISARGIIERDELVFQTVVKYMDTPRVVMVLSGGYATASNLGEGAEDIFDIIGRSVINLKKVFGDPLQFQTQMDPPQKKKTEVGKRKRTDENKRSSRDEPPLKKKSRKKTHKRTPAASTKNSHTVLRSSQKLQSRYQQGKIAVGVLRSPFIVTT